MKQVKTQIGKVALVVMLGMLLQSCVTNNSDELAEKKQRDAAQANAQLGARALQDDNLKEAREKLEKALEQDDQNALVHLVYAQLQHRVGKVETARTHYNKAMKLEPEESSHRNSYGVFLCKIKEYSEALEQFSIAASDAYYATPQFALDNAGVCMLEANELDKAEGYLRKALNEDPRFPNAYLHMSELLYKRGYLLNAQAYLDRFTTYHKGDTAESLLLNIQINGDAGREKEANLYASRLLNEFPGSLEAGEYLGRPLQ